VLSQCRRAHIRRQRPDPPVAARVHRLPEHREPSARVT
jgi:hypothetical protein